MKIIVSRKHLIISIALLFISSSFTSVLGGFLPVDENNGIKSSFVPGDYFRHIIADGRIRSYRLHIPPNYNDGNPMPIVFVLHGSGFGANSVSTKSYCDMDEKADEEGFITVYPNGEILRLSTYIKHPIAILWDLYALITHSREWNRWNENNVDDVGFIRTLIYHLETVLNVNSSRIYIMGISGGAMMTYRLGAELSDHIAAIAPIAGTIGGIGYEPAPYCSQSSYVIPKPINPLPVITFHGMQDEEVPFEGGWKKVVEWGSGESWVYLVSVNESVSFWVEYNNCDPTPQVKKSESGHIITRTYTNGNASSEVVLVTYIEGGHEWFKSPPHEISAIDIIWDFFEQHPQ